MIESLAELQGAPWNPRTITPAALEGLKVSLKSFGDLSGIVFNVRLKCLVCGHQRLAALKEQYGDALIVEQVDGHSEIITPDLKRFPVREVDWDEPTTMAANLAANSHLIAGTFTPKIHDIAGHLNVTLPDLSAALRLPELKLSVPQELPPEGDDTKAPSESESVTEIGHDSYCALHERFDLGTGPCLFNCAYCFVLAKPHRRLPKQIHPKSESALKTFVEKTEAGSGELVTGLCIEPTLEPLYPCLVKLMGRMKAKGLFLQVQTKNPGAVLLAMQETSFPAELLAVKVAFGSFRSDWCAALEPAAPSLADRLATSKALLAIGVDVMPRLQPFFLGHLEGMGEVLDHFKGAPRLVATPLRVSRFGWKQFQEIERRIPEFSLDKYFEEWGRKGDESMYGALHWLDYDRDKLRDHYVRIKAAANERGMQFGICSATNGIEYCDLNDGDTFCCATPSQLKFGVRYDTRAIAVRVMQKRIHEIRVPALLSMKDRVEWEYELSRISWANDPRYPIPGEGS